MLDISKSTNDELIEQLDYCGYDPYYNDLRQEVIAEIKLRMGGHDITQCDDAKFLTHIISEICNYAVANDMEPNDTLSKIATNIQALLTISTFNGWQRR